MKRRVKMNIRLAVLTVFSFIIVAASVQAQDMMPDLEVEYTGSQEVKKFAAAMFLEDIPVEAPTTFNEDANASSEDYSFILPTVSFKISSIFSEYLGLDDKNLSL